MPDLVMREGGGMRNKCGNKFRPGRIGRPVGVMTGIFLMVLTTIPAFANQRMLCILDCSGSMWGRVENTPKIVLAKDALLSLFSDMPDTVDVGVMAYGHRKKGDCRDIEMIIDFGGSRADLADRVGGLNALGKTPISGALAKAGTALAGTEDSATIVLISDGIETCGEDPCKVAEQLLEEGIRVVIHTVGFDVHSDAAKQLDCIARAGKGRFFKADDIRQLRDALMMVKTAVVTETPVPAPPEMPPVETETAPSKTLRIAGPGTVKLQPAEWVRMPPANWGLADVETGDIKASGSSDQLRVKTGEYQIKWRQSEHGHTDTLLTAVVRVESGKTIEVPIDTGVRINTPDGIAAPRYWGLVMPGERKPFWTTREVGIPQVVPAGTYRIYWHQSEHDALPVILGETTVENGRLNDIAADSGLVLQSAEWAPARYYYYGLKTETGEMAGSWKKLSPQLAPAGNYNLILRPTEHHHNEIVWGAVDIPAHDFAKISIDSGIRFLHAPDAKPPYRIFLVNLDSGHEIALKESWDVLPAPPGRYRLDWWESQHGSVRQTLADEFMIDAGVLLEVEM